MEAFYMEAFIKEAFCKEAFYKEAFYKEAFCKGGLFWVTPIVKPPTQLQLNLTLSTLSSPSLTQPNPTIHRNSKVSKLLFNQFGQNFKGSVKLTFVYAEFTLVTFVLVTIVLPH